MNRLKLNLVLPFLLIAISSVHASEITGNLSQTNINSNINSTVDTSVMSTDTASSSPEIVNTTNQPSAYAATSSEDQNNFLGLSLWFWLILLLIIILFIVYYNYNSSRNKSEY